MQRFVMIHHLPQNETLAFKVRDAALKLFFGLFSKGSLNKRCFYHMLPYKLVFGV